MLYTNNWIKAILIAWFPTKLDLIRCRRNRNDGSKYNATIEYRRPRDISVKTSLLGGWEETKMVGQNPWPISNSNRMPEIIGSNKAKILDGAQCYAHFYHLRQWLLISNTAQCLPGKTYISCLGQVLWIQKLRNCKLYKSVRDDILFTIFSLFSTRKNRCYVYEKGGVWRWISAGLLYPYWQRTRDIAVLHQTTEGDLAESISNLRRGDIEAEILPNICVNKI